MGMFDGFADKAKAFGSAVVGGADKVAKDIGAGFAYNSKDAQNARQADADLMAQAGKLEEKARAAKDPQEAGRLHLLASKAYAQVGQNAQDANANYSSDVGENNFARAGNAAVGIVTAADMGANPIAAIKAPFQMIKGGVNFAKNAAKFTTEDATKLMGQAKNLPGMAADYLKADAAQSFKLPSAGNSPAGDAAAAQAAGQQPQPGVPPTQPGQPPVQPNAPQPGPQFAGDQPAMPQAPDGAPPMQAQPAPVATNLDAFAPKGGNPMLVQQKADPQVIRDYGSIFQVPRPVAHSFSMNQDDVINHLIHDGVTNVRSLDDVKNVAQTVTGKDTSVFPTINRIILQNTEHAVGPVDFTTARTAADNEIASTLDGVKGGILNTVKRDIHGAFPKYEHEGELPSTMPENHANLTDLLKTSQRLGKLDAMYEGKAFKSTTGELNNTDYELAMQAVREIKNNVDDIINEATKTTYQQFKEDPAVVAQLERLPGGIDGPLAQRWLSSATKFKDGQTIQMPYVNADKMVNYTKDTQFSAFTKWTNEMQDKRMNKSGDMVENVKNFAAKPWETTVNAVGNKVQQKLSPMIDATPEDLMAERTSGQSAQLKNTAGGPADGAAGAANTDMHTTVKTAEIGNNLTNGTYGPFNPHVQAANGAPNDDSNKESHTIGGNIAQFDSNVNTIDKIPQGINDLKANADGTRGIANIYAIKDQNGKQLFMDSNSIKQKQEEINAAKATMAYKYQPEEQLRVDKMQNDLDAVSNFSGTIKPEYDKALTKNNAYSQAILDLKDAPKSILNYNGKFDDFIKQVSTTNADLATQLKIIEANGGIDPNKDIKGETLLTSLQTAQAGGLLNFYSKLGSATGYTGGQAAPPSPVNTAQPAGDSQDSGGSLFTPVFDNGQSAFAH